MGCTGTQGFRSLPRGAPFPGRTRARKTGVRWPAGRLGGTCPWRAAGRCGPAKAARRRSVEGTQHPPGGQGGGSAASVWLGSAGGPAGRLRRTGCRPEGERPGADVEARLREPVGRSRQKSERRRREEGLPPAAGLRASARPGAGRGRGSGSGRVGEGGRGWARGKRGGRKTSSCSCSCSQLGRKDALRRTEGSWGGGAGGGRQRVCGERQWRGEDGCVCPAGQKAGLSGVGFEPTPPEETVIRIQCL